MRTIERWVLPAVLLMAGAAPLAAQGPSTYEACYVPDVGAIYLINQTGLPSGCLAPSHVAFSWTTGELADSAVTEAMLAFDPATQAELDAFIAGLNAAGTINAAGNPVDWTQLKNVPAELADGTDNTGGTPSDLVCAGCVETTDLADGAVSGAKLANGVVAESHLGFDPTTQAELDAFIAGLAAGGVINAAGNPVDWTQLKNVPADFADGVDNSGGTPSDLVCSGCVDPTDLADAAVTAAKLAAAAVDVSHMAFDPATQAELDAHAASGDHDGRYFTETELSSAGTINDTGNPVDWTQLKNVPADFADGVDDTGGGGVADHGALTGLVDDDHPQYALADGVRNTTNGFAVTGTFNVGTIPATGAGARLMWYPGQAAFRAGYAAGTQWDAASVGTFSAALGLSTQASGTASTALGIGSLASGDYSTALGRSTVASGRDATATGINTTASGLSSTAMGSATEAAGDGSTAMGSGTLASGGMSTAMGQGTTAQSWASLAIGRYNVATGSPGGWNVTDPLFVAGNGTSDAARSNALTLYKNGDLDLAGAVTATAFVGDGSGLTNLPSGVSDHGALSGLVDDDHPQYLLAGVRDATDGFAVTGTPNTGTIPVSGAGVRLMWYPGKGAFRAGRVNGIQWDDPYVGLESTAMGFTAMASGPQSTAFGSLTTASGSRSTAFGQSTTASGTASTAMGQQTTASGSVSTALGLGTTAQAFGALAIGRYNVIAGDQTQWLGTDPLFVAGNGASAVSPSNALTLYKNGDLELAGTVTAAAFLGDGSGLTNLPTGVTDHGGLSGLVDDDHPQYVLAEGVRNTTDGFALTGTFGSGTIPVSGSGTRLMWYPGKAAFRAGYVTGTQWDAASVGDYSTAMGVNPTASGVASTAMGNVSIASGAYATAMGSSTEASGATSTALGISTVASGNAATAMGALTMAQAYGSLAIGRYNAVAGSQTQWLATDPLFVAGNGTSGGARSNALTLYKNGNLDLAGTLTAAAFVGDGSGLTNLPSGVTDHGGLTGLGDDDHPQYVLAEGVRYAPAGFALTGTLGSGTIPVSGTSTRLMWYPGKAAFRAGRAGNTSWDDANVGPYSAAMGFNTTASGDYSAATGYATTASGNFSTAMNADTEASGIGATVMGRQTIAQSYASLVIGVYNVVDGDPASWIANDPLFVAGNGIGPTARSNALVLRKNGNLAIAGTLSQNSDIRLKENIESLDHALDDVLGLTPIRYRFREGTGHPTERQIGLSAQEVERAFPELVSRDSEGYLSVAYANLTAVLVRAVQEQQEQIEALRAEMAALRTARAERAHER